VESQYWISGEWLYWSFRNAPLPPVISTGDPNYDEAGIPGGGNVRSLVPGSRDLGMFHGARLSFGGWLDQEGKLGVEVSAFLLERKGTLDRYQGSPSQPLSVPFLSSDGVFGVYDFSYPNSATGALAIATGSQLLGAEANILHRWYTKGSVSVDGLFGYRFASLAERFDLYGQTTAGGPLMPDSPAVFTTDSVRARNEFHGGQIGLRARLQRDMFAVTVFGKYGVGANIQTLNTWGSTTVNTAGGTQSAVGGVRVLPSNLGRFTNTDFSMIAETGIEIGVRVTNHVGLRVGYNLLFWSDVLRPANVVSPVLTQSQVPLDPSYDPTVRGARPAVAFRSSDFLAHGLTAGIVLDW
jgi:hypothetical protein